MTKSGSEIAKAGYDTESLVVLKFINWNTDNDVITWLEKMGYNLKEIQSVYAQKLHGQKTDVQIQVSIKLKTVIDVQNIQVKLVTTNECGGFNQVDKRWVDSYKNMWNIPDSVVQTLKYYVGENPPPISNVRDKRRMFLSEMNNDSVIELVNWLSQNLVMIVNDVLRGRGRFTVEWLLVLHQTNQTERWFFESINPIMNYYSNGGVNITANGNLKIGKISIQRKGGDAGAKTAQMLQFKIDPLEYFKNNLTIC